MKKLIASVLLSLPSIAALQAVCYEPTACSINPRCTYSVPAVMIPAGDPTMNVESIETLAVPHCGTRRVYLFFRRPCGRPAGAKDCVDPTI